MENISVIKVVSFHCRLVLSFHAEAIFFFDNFGLSFPPKKFGMHFSYLILLYGHIHFDVTFEPV